jgi:PadR family transcriptional regulator, regulatory protein PadR
VAKIKTDLLQGTLDLLVLKTLSLGPLHGWGIAQRIQQMSQAVLRVNQGSLYPALHRLEVQGWLATDQGLAENNRRVRYYHLTPSGRRQLEAEKESWASVSAAITRILRTT